MTDHMATYTFDYDAAPTTYQASCDCGWTGEVRSAGLGHDWAAAQSHDAAYLAMTRDYAIHYDTETRADR